MCSAHFPKDCLIIRINSECDRLCVLVCTHIFMRLNVLPRFRLTFSFLQGITKYSLGQKPTPWKCFLVLRMKGSRGYGKSWVVLFRPLQLQYQFMTSGLTRKKKRKGQAVGMSKGWPAFEMLNSSVLEKIICKKTEGLNSIEVIKVRTLEMKGTKNFLNSQGDLSNISHKIICRVQSTDTH